MPERAGDQWRPSLRWKRDRRLALLCRRPDPLKAIQDLRDCADVSLVGGKAANLGALLRAGFVVPDGFVMTTVAQEADVESIREAYRRLSAPEVAVRSSAAIEDGASLSMAGQFKTILNVRSEAELLNAIRLCRTSSETSRARAYLNESRTPRQTPMAVVIQRQVGPDVAGVLFTQSPQKPDEMLIEAAPGLGDDVISGRAKPDVFRVNPKSGRIINSESHREQPSLTSEDVERLCALGRDVASHFGSPQDIEWAISNNTLFLLQARPITTSDRETFRQSLVQDVRKNLASSGGGPWTLHNLAETVPHPTPLTWSILRRFMAGSGGFGAMYRQLGFDSFPGEVLELIAGKIYIDLSRAPGLFGKNFPFAYDPELVQRDPSAAQLPPSVSRGSWMARFRARRQIRKATRKIDNESIDFDEKLTRQIIPSFVQWCAEEKKRDLSRLSPEQWIALWRERERRLFDDFAPKVFFTNFIAATALQRLRNFVAIHFWNESPDALTQLLASTGQPDETICADAALREVARGERSLTTWLARYGHRGIGEFDLAAPRWREVPSAVVEYADHLKDAPDPIHQHRQRIEQARQRIEQLPARTARRLEERVELARRYLIFREAGKHYLMLGYDLLRDMVIDASHRLKADVVWLTIDELIQALRDGFVARQTIDDRKREFLAEARINLPQFIDASSLSRLDKPPELESPECIPGVGISSGFASGPARIVESPLEARDLGKNYVLICPSTDPQWTPLFFNASAIVLGMGGTLSHGAIVAREMNLPAVVLPDATRLFENNEELFVNGSTGMVSRSAHATKPLPGNEPISPDELPPVPGKHEWRAAQLRNIGFIFWGLFLIAAWSLPENWLYQPALHVLDTLLWPIVRTLGRPLAVALIAAGLALVTALTQAVIVDNARIREVRRRCHALVKRAATLRADSPQRRALMSTAGQGHFRIFGAGLVPIGVLLGVFIFNFAWLGERINKTNPAPGSAARAVVTINADCSQPITLSVKPPLWLDESTPAVRVVPPIRQTLERIAAKGQMSSSALADLKDYLRHGVPPQTLSWLIHSNVAGSFPVAIAFGKTPLIRTSAVFGDGSPPPAKQQFRARRLPLRSVVVEDAVPKSGFWNTNALIPRLDQNIAWPWIYLLAYLLPWLVLRRWMRLA